MSGQSDALSSVLHTLLCKLPPVFLATAPEHFEKRLSEVDVQDKIQDEITGIVDSLKKVRHLRNNKIQEMSLSIVEFTDGFRHRTYPEIGDANFKCVCIMNL